ncbi:MAG: SDR family oxidoreductase [Methanobacteriaceae archaeon]|nr:SDR family oxidoreductase [Methanobacteriaceae archaeon]
MKNKKVLVTGGLGFIGSHLVEKLSHDNQVIIVDDQSTGKMANIEEFDQDNISIVLGDINQIDLVNTMDGCDYVFHHAALASVPASVDNPLLCNKVNVTGTLKVLVAARDANVQKVVFASSSAVYGDNENLPLSEDILLNPLSPYASSKASGEMYCKNFTDLFDLSTISLRYFNVFGPRQDPNSQYAAVIPKFIDAYIHNEKPVIFGDGKQTRDFIYVKDVVNANIIAAESNITGVYNIASGEVISINQLIELIEDIVGEELDVKYEDPRNGDIKHSTADISKAKSSGLIKKHDLKSNLEETVVWFNETINYFNRK